MGEIHNRELAQMSIPPDAAHDSGGIPPLAALRSRRGSFARDLPASPSDDDGVGAVSSLARANEEDGRSGRRAKAP